MGPANGGGGAGPPCSKGGVGLDLTRVRWQMTEQDRVNGFGDL